MDNEVCSKVKRLVILSGLPGSGKSTIASQLDPTGAKICSADNYYIGRDGVYRFDPTKIGKAHGMCQEKARDMIEREEPLIIIDNTNVSLNEAETYVRMVSEDCHEKTYDIEFIRPTHKSSVEDCVASTVHAVPAETVQKMANRLVPLHEMYSYFSGKYPFIKFSYKEC